MDRDARGSSTRERWTTPTWAPMGGNRFRSRGGSDRSRTCGKCTTTRCTASRLDLVEAKLLDEIEKLKSLTAGAGPAGARVHILPEKPRDIEDDGEFHFAVLGPKAASDSGKPSAEARRFLDETTGADRPRVYRQRRGPGRAFARGARRGPRTPSATTWAGRRCSSQLKDQDLDPIRERHSGRQPRRPGRRCPRRSSRLTASW